MLLCLVTVVGWESSEHRDPPLATFCTVLEPGSTMPCERCRYYEVLSHIV